MQDNAREARVSWSSAMLASGAVVAYAEGLPHNDLCPQLMSCSARRRVKLRHTRSGGQIEYEHQTSEM